MKRVLLEVAVDSFEAALAAADAGADRLELCSQLSVGGLTPSVELFRRVRDAVSIPIVVMIRPRGGHFVFDGRESAEIGRSMATFRRWNSDGFVFGALTEAGAIDRAACAKFIRRCAEIPAIFHRAWDERPRSAADLELLIELGFRRLLTSGGARAAFEGVSVVRESIEQAAGRIEILPGAGIAPGNVEDIVRRTGCTQVHGTFKNSAREMRAVLDQLAGSD